MKGEGNQQDYGIRIYDPRLGRFLSVDPITKQYPELTPYQFASNTPIEAIDLDGLEKLPYIKKFDYTGGLLDPIAAIDNGVINVLNLAPELWNSLVSTYESIERGTVVQDIKSDLKNTWSGLKSTANHVVNKPFSPLTLELITTVYVSGKVPLPGATTPKGNLLKATVSRVENGAAEGAAAAEGTVAAEAAKGGTTALTEYWPRNGGALGEWGPKFLMPGDEIDRFGSVFGKYLSPRNTPMDMRALPVDNTGIYNAYKVLKPFEVQSSIIAPAFGKIGLGEQFLSPVNVQTLLKRGIIEKIKTP